jgi:P27 family predicted phage terminase small subunit
MRVWTSADRETIGRYCQLHELHARYVAECRAGGDRLITKTGYEAISPAATLLTKLGASLLSIEKEYGLTPSARAHIAAPPLAGDEDHEPEALLLQEFIRPNGRPVELAKELRARGLLH